MRQKKDKYQIEYAEKLISWFKNAPLYNTETHKIYSKKSDKCEEVYEKVDVSVEEIITQQSDTAPEADAATDAPEDNSAPITVTTNAPKIIFITI